MKEIKSKLLSCFILFCAFLVSGTAVAQLEVTGGFDSDQLAQILVGAGVEVFNSELNCGEDGSGAFDGEFTNIGMDGGILLTSGTIDNAVGPNNQSGASANLGTPGDPDLDQTIPGFTTNDACVFEFDFIPYGDSIQFNYVFGSDEYLEFAFSAFNDAFGFFLSGPGISGPFAGGAENIAIIPGTSDAVTIDNVNDVNNSQYFVCNGDPNSNCNPFFPSDINSTVQYDGLTTVLQAIAAVTPCDTYHLKLAIADAGDSALDSGVFLEASSLSVDIVTISATTTLTTVEGLDSAVEGCVDGIVTFQREFATSSPVDINYEISGTAENGVDYTFLPGVITIPANGTEAELLIDFLDDSVIEGIETFTITVTTDFGCAEELVQEATIEVIDATPMEVDFNEVTIQSGEEAELGVTGGGLNYFWTPLQDIIGANTANPTVSPMDTTVYTITSAIGDCIYQEEVTVNVLFDDCNVNAFFMAPAEICTCDPVVALSPSQTGGVWSGTGIDISGNFNPMVLSPGTYTITYVVSDPSIDGCSDTFSLDIVVYSPPNPSFNSASFCTDSAPAALTAGTPGGVWSGPGIDPVTGVFDPSMVDGAGSYDITYTVTNDQGVEESETNTVTVTEQGDATFTTQEFCHFDAPPVQLQAVTPGGTWSGTGVSASGIFDPAAVPSPGGYTITHTVGSGSCSDSFSAVVTVNALPNSSFSSGTFVPGGTAGALTPAIPGGTWSGTGVDGSGVFDPFDLTPGSYPITYSVTSSEGCSTSSTFNVSVIQVGDACFPPQSFCEGSGAVALLANEAGGTWSGPGVSVDGIFTPGASGVYTLTHTVGVGAGQTSCDGEITVFALPDPNFIQEDFCEMGPSSSITPITLGGTWSGVGISPGGVFDPSGLVPGEYPVTYTISSGADCTASLTQNITIFPLPVSSFTEVSFCAGTPPTQLVAVTPGGTWAGIGVSPSGVFDPSVGVGSYVIEHTVQGAGGCIHTSNRIISVIASGDASFSGASVCFGGSPIQLTATNPGGTWSGSGMSSTGMFNPAGLAAGDYTVSYMTGGDGCEATASNTVTVLPLPDSNFADAFVCSGSAPIQLTANVAGGSWSGSGMSASGMFDPAGLTPGTYTVSYTVTNSQGCTSTSSGSVTVGELPNSSFGSASVCDGGTPIQLTAAVAGGTWSGSGMSASGMFNPAGLAPGAYTISYTVTNAQGCTSTSSGSVTVGGLPNSSFDSVSVCDGGTPIQLTAAVAGGTWSGSGMSASGMFNPSGLTPGTYTVTYTIFNGEGCTSSSSGTVTIGELPTSTLNSVSVCESSAPIQLTAASSGGTWSGTNVSASGMFDPAGLAPGTYSVTYMVTDGAGCTSTSTGTVTVNGLPDSSFGDVSVCDGGDAVQLVAATEGGTWSGTGISASGVFNPTGLPAGTYTVSHTVTTAEGCSTTSTGTVSVADNPVTTFPELYFCIENGPTQLTATTAGGTWSGQGVSPSGVFDPTNLIAGVYEVTYMVTNSTGCSSISTGNITISNQPDSNFSGGFVCENGASIQLNPVVNGGVWTGEGVGPTGIFDPTGLDAGVYLISYTVTNLVGCSSTSTSLISVSEVPNSSFPDAFICEGDGSVQLMPVSLGGTWSGAGINASGVFSAAGLAPGDYTVSYSVPNLVGCETAYNGTVTVGQGPAVSITDAFVCADGGSIQLSASIAGGTWSGTGINASGVFSPAGLGAGSYTVSYTATSTDGCVSSATGTVTVGSNPNSAVTGVSVCAGDLAQLTAPSAGGTWSGSGINSSGLFNSAGLAVGNYTVTYSVTNADGCSSSSTTTVTVLSPPDSSVEDAFVCGDAGPIQLTSATAGGVWSGTGVSASGSFDPTGLAVGSYSVTYSVSNAQNCSSSSTATVTVGAGPNTSFADAFVCAGGNPITIGVSNSGGTWSGDGMNADGTFDPAGLAAGDYEISYTFTSAQGCSSTSTGTVTVGAGPNTSFADAFVCSGGNPITIGVSNSGGTWSGDGMNADGTFDPAGLAAGDYEISYTFTSAEGCTSTSTGTVTVGEVTMGTLDFGPFCEDAGSVQLTVATVGGTWSGSGISADGTFDPSIGAGTYTATYTLTSAEGCTSITTATIVVSPAPDSSIEDMIICEEVGTMALSATTAGGNWSGDGVSFDGTFDTSVGPGTYTVTYSVTSEIGCGSSSSATITVGASPDASFDSITLCIGDEAAQLTGATDGGTWSGVGIDADGTFDPAGVVAGTYDVSYTVTTGDDCTATATGTVTVVALPEVSIIAPTLTCADASVTMTASPDGGTWDGATDGVFDPTGLDAGDYTVTYTYADDNGCEASASVTITVLEPVVITVLAEPVCLGFTGMYEIVISVSGGNGGPYDMSSGGSVNADEETVLVGMGDGSEVTYTVTDSDGCSATYTFTLEACGTCNPVAGSMEDVVVCGDEDLTIVNGGADASSVDTLVYVFHSSATFDESEIVFVSGSATVNAADVGYGEFFVTAVAANLNEDGSIPFSGECVDLSAAASVTFVPPVVVNFEIECDGDIGIFTMTYSISGGMPSIDPTTSYEIGGDASFDAIFAGETFVLDYADGDNVNITATDAMGCTGELDSDPVSCVKCGSSQGDMPQEPIFVCGSGTAQAQASNFTQFGTTLTYIFHTSVDDFPGTILATGLFASQGIFSFDDIPGAEFDTEYYISAVIGPVDADGFPVFDPFNTCIVEMPGPAVTFSSGGLGVEVFDEVICAEDYDSYTVVVNVAAADDTEFTVTVGGSTGIVSGGAPFISASIPADQGYEIMVSDGSCSTTVVNPNVSCAPATNIELLDFTGLVKTEGNQLDWSLASANDLNKFVIERSTDGQEFRLLDVVPGQGNSNTVQTYDYFDVTAPGGTSYYRLQIVENDGAVSYSNTIALDRPTMGLEIVNLQPIPTKDELTITVQSQDLDNVELAVYDMAGKQITNQKVQLISGINTLTLDVSQFAAGVYTLQLSNGTSIATERLVKE